MQATSETLHFLLFDDLCERGCVISTLRSNTQAGHAFRPVDPDLNFSPLTVIRVIQRTVPEHILILQIDADLCAYAFQVVNGWRKERTASGQVCKILQYSSTAISGALRAGIVHNSDGINLHIMLLCKLAHV